MDTRDKDWLNVSKNGDADEEREVWFTAAALWLTRAYGEDEPEYPLELIKEWNPDFRGWR